MQLKKYGLYMTSSGKLYFYSEEYPKGGDMLLIISGWVIPYNTINFDNFKIPLGMGAFGLEMYGSDKQYQKLKVEYDPLNVDHLEETILAWQIPYPNTIGIYSTEWGGLSLEKPNNISQYTLMYILDSRKFSTLNDIKFSCKNGYCIPDNSGKYNISNCLTVCNDGIANKPPLINELKPLENFKSSGDSGDSGDSNNNKWYILILGISIVILLVIILLIFIFLK